MAGLLLAGDLFLDRLTDAGASTGLLGPLNGVKLAISNPDPEAKERVSRMKDTLGQALDVVNIPKPAELSIDIDDQPPEILALALIGSIEDTTQGAGSATDEAITLIPDRWVELGHRNIVAAGFSIATAAAPSTPLVAGTDYVVDYAAGMIKALSTGAIATSTACLADYSYSASTGKRINGGANPIANCRIVLNGKNLVTGKAARLEVDFATLSPTGEIDLLSGEFVTTQLKGKMKTLEGETAPYRYEEFTDA